MGSFSSFPLRYGRAVAIAPILLALGTSLLPTGVGIPAAWGQTRGLSAERVRRLMNCIEEFGFQPNNAALEVCQTYGADGGEFTAVASNRSSRLTNNSATRSIAGTSASSSTARATSSATAGTTTSGRSSTTASAPPRAQSFGPGSVMEIPRGDRNPAQGASSPRAVGAGPTASPSTAGITSDRQRAILGCLGDHGTDNRNGVLNECGAWEPDDAPAASPSTNPTPSNGASRNLSARGAGQNAARVTSRSTGGGLGGNGSGNAPDRRPLSNPSPTSPGGGSATRTTPAFIRQGGTETPTGQPGSSVPSSVPAAPIADAGGTDGVSDDSEPTLDDLAIAPSSDVSERGQVSDDFDDRRLANFICREVTRNFVRCDPEDEIADGGNTGGDGENNGGNNVGSGGGAIASSVSGAISFACNESESTLRTRGVTRITQGTSTIYVGFVQTSPNNQDPRIARFDNGQQVWCREDYEITGDDSTGYGLVWDGGDRLYAAFTSTGSRGTPDRDFRRFATNGWLSSYGAGGGPSVTVLAQISPNTGDVRQATFISALQSNGSSNSLRLTELGLGANTVTIRANSAFSPRRPDRSAFSCTATGVGGFDYTATFTADLSTVTQAGAPGCS
ncbi:MAG: hypothetical protein AAF685_15280 [Cyanobacteria bacterium P01_C01_bin.89]